MKILIVGGSGFIGSNLVRYFANRHYVVVATYHRHPVGSGTNWLHLDISDEAEVKSVLAAVEPTAIINVSGIKNAKYCELNQAESRRTNTIGVRHLAREAGMRDIHLAHLSDDQVFEGLVGQYSETSLALPDLALGETKIAGEHLAQGLCAATAICRASAVYGLDSPVIDYVAAELGAGRYVRATTNYYCSPTYVMNLAEMLEAIIKARSTGIFHTAGAERVNRYGFYRAYAEVFGFDQNLIVPVDHPGYPEPIDRSLCCGRFDTMLKIPRRTIRSGLMKLKEETESVL